VSGEAIDKLLSPRRDAAAAQWFFRKALAQPHTVNPRTITVDKNPAYPFAITEMKRRGGLWRFSRLRQCKYLNNIVEQDHRRIKRLVRPGLGFGGLRTAVRTLAGYEAMAMIRKGQVPNVGGRDMRAQIVSVASPFEMAIWIGRPPTPLMPRSRLCNTTFCSTTTLLGTMRYQNDRDPPEIIPSSQIRLMAQLAFVKSGSAPSCP
jgi:hypothetical protein